MNRNYDFIKFISKHLYFKKISFADIIQVKIMLILKKVNLKTPKYGKYYKKHYRMQLLLVVCSFEYNQSCYIYSLGKMQLHHILSLVMYNRYNVKGVC